MPIQTLKQVSCRHYTVLFSLWPVSSGSHCYPVTVVLKETENVSSRSGVDSRDVIRALELQVGLMLKQNFGSCWKLFLTWPWWGLMTQLLPAKSKSKILWLAHLVPYPQTCGWCGSWPKIYSSQPEISHGSNWPEHLGWAGAAPRWLDCPFPKIKTKIIPDSSLRLSLFLPHGCCKTEPERPLQIRRDCAPLTYILFSLFFKRSKQLLIPVIPNVRKLAK